MKNQLLVLLFCSLSIITSFAQKVNAQYEYAIKKASGKIEIDGKLDDAGWQNCAITSDFWMVTPADTSKALLKTKAKFTYDDNFLYFSCINYQAGKAPYIVESLKRDFNFGRNDNLWLILEPFNDLTNGWVFGSNAAGAQFDGQIGEGTILNPNWDNRWTSKTTFEGDKWILEMAIPFSSLRYKAGEKRWGMNISRLDLGTNEKSVWAPIPRQFFSVTLAYTGSLVWDNPPPTPKTNISVIPYVLGGINRNLEKKEAATYRKDMGGDAKIALSPSLNLDLTINPDFSQVDVDQQVTNFNRFELFFPERRQFFLENSDIFNSFGSDDTRPFFSRRIGLGTPIQYGARLSGKLNNNWRIGVLNSQTSANKDSSVRLPTYNYSVLALQRKVFSRSNISMMMVNKEGINFKDENAQKGFNKYNRNAVLQYNMASKDNTWFGKIALMKSFSPRLTTNDYAQHINVGHTTRTWNLGITYTRVGENYQSEVGFVPRRGYHYLSPSIGYLFYPKDSRVVFHGPKFRSFNYRNTRQNVPTNVTLSADNTTTNVLFYNFTFRNRASLDVWAATDDVLLFSPFNPINPYLKDYYVKNRSEHAWKATGLIWVSSPRNLLTYGLTTRYGGYYGDGTRLSINGQVGYRFQPFVSLSLSTEYNSIKNVNVFKTSDSKPTLASADYWLIQSKFDITFTNKLFWTTYLQYNEQVSNVNLNSRIQWRYKPASDIFLVYSDNYLPENLGIKNKSIVLKWNYWWNY
ncbi:MAG: DUF5916 domain-containing protein [Saprospiraceae bacterium]|nr:DUF5916 domain-containing protein [Saprospiraceae bacterium]